MEADPEIMDEPSWDEYGESPPHLSDEDLAKVDYDSDKFELERLVAMGAVRPPRTDEDISTYETLTTKIVRDWRRRPGWTRRSRLVAREFRSWTPWTQELFAPASCLSVVHSFISLALSKGLEITTLDIKDAYLNVKQKAPVIIQVDAELFGDGERGQVPFILERLLPGQRVAASEWFGYMKDLLGKCGLQGFAKEPTLFHHSAPGNDTSLVLHADDGLLASTPEERDALMQTLGAKVKVQVSEPLKETGSELEFLKRKYIKVPEGVLMYSGRKHLDGLLDALGAGLKERDTPADSSFLEPDTGRELNNEQAKVFKECVGRLLYLSHTRADIQFATCVLASKMSSPTITSMKWLQRVVGYLLRVPSLGFLIKPIKDGACLGFPGKGDLESRGKIIVESITDACWAGCKRTRRSRSSVQLYVGGSLVASMVRSQRSIALSSRESEFILVGGSGEMIYLKECLQFLVKEAFIVEARAACRGITQRLGCGRIRHLDCGLLWVQDAVRRLNKALRSSASGINNVKQVMPILLVLSQLGAVEGLGLGALAVGMVSPNFDDSLISGLSTCAVALLFMMLFLGVPYGCLWFFQRGLFILGRRIYVWRVAQGGTRRNMGVQAGMSRVGRQFSQEYVDRSTYYETLRSEKCREVERCETALRQVRERNRQLEAELVRARAMQGLQEK